METKKIALVTGASSGIGYASSIELAKRGYKVYAGARRLEQMKPLEEYGITLIQLDVTSTESIRKAKELIESETDRLDVLFNNAGVPCGAPAIEVSDKDFEKCYEVNLYGPIRLTREFSSLVIKAKGVFAYTSSTAGLLPFPFGSIYSSSKAALTAYVSTLALEVKPFGAKVLDFISGGVKTEILDIPSVPLKADSVYIVDGVNLFEKSRAGLDTLGAMPVSKYAVKVVNDIDYVVKGKFWFYEGNYFTSFRGTFASIVKFVTSFLPRAVIENMLLTNFKIADDFNKISRKEKRS